ncbi:hypothetical protein AXG93_1052s1150 [Marchantia polymorpha subsp. ruderalis]|uniref:COP9 signalosome complex subunit 3 n=1 Tax=Marchantia polymorpha subsp. ruderalis TaxID=1480154 RepID=A0A176VVH2_MARPO|nr:hypothetical protein AXG93_1052s1150 [Marchantia polymorpha subsp. ruderalis]
MMDSLDAVVTQVQALSGSADDCVHLAGLLKQSESVLAVHAPRLLYALAALDPAKHSLGYLYLLGMLYIGLKRFGKALEFFQHAITAPATVLNAITIAAYKKFVLVCLIHNGQVPPFPKYTPSVVQRNLKSCAQDYFDLANLYNSRNIMDVKRCVNAHEDVFKNDTNLGLANQVIASLYKRNIQRLTQTYLTLSLQDIADTVQLDGPKEAELHILQMIQDGEIFATINQKDGMVSFQEDPEQYNTRKMANMLDSEIQHIIRLAKKLSSVDEQVLCDQNYLSKIGKDRPRYDPDDFELVPQKMYTNL